MGDVSAEPSMEDILSSIKRIIAEEGEPVPAPKRRAAVPRAAPPVVLDEDEDDEADLDAVLELKDPIPPSVERAAEPEEDLPRPLSSGSAPADPAPTARAPAEPAAAAPAAAAAPTPIVSSEAASAARGSLEALSRMMVRPEPASDGTLEGLVREMLRPMLAEWLDAKLPPMVETMVNAEIARITGTGR